MKNRNFLQSLKSAFRGIYITYISQRNFRIQVSFAILVIYFGLKFKVGIMNMIILLFTILLVLSFELINTSIEFLSDKIESKYDILIKNSKDTLSGLVLLASIVSVIIGFIIFFKYIRYLTYKSIIFSLIIIIVPAIIKSNNDIIKKEAMNN
ncbi:MAG: diacylglycerol kinase family protein [Caldisericia bacterium]|nr:diacylglycerol kinase family protein [Caldisericia bacterium]NLI55956.1 diacylglycerol kinase family protein [bacterium]